MNTAASTDTRHAGGRSNLVIGATVMLYLAAALGGFALGFVFVSNAQGGAIMGLAAGLNGALFCTLLADWLLTRLFRRRKA
jgi:hypothetical protein